MRNYQDLQHREPGRVRALAEELGHWNHGSTWVALHRKLLTLADFDFIRLNADETVSLCDESAAVAVMALFLCEQLSIAGAGHVAKMERAKKVLDEVGDLVEPLDATFHALGFSLIVGDPDQVLALTAILCDNRNFDASRLTELGRRVLPAIVEVARDTISQEVLDAPTVCVSRAECRFSRKSKNRNSGKITRKDAIFPRIETLVKRVER